MEYQLSRMAYPEKPKKSLWGKILWEDKDTDTPTLAEYLEDGYIYRPKMDNLLNYDTKTFVSAQYIFLDVENNGEEPPTLEYFLENTRIKPTLYYYTYNGSHENIRYRLGYFLDKPIMTPVEFMAVAKAVIDYTGILNEKMLDPKSWSCYQNVCGTNKKVELTYRGYRLEDMRKLAEDFMEKETERKTRHVFDFKLDYDEYDLMCDFFQEGVTFENWISENDIDKELVFESFPDRMDETFLYYDNYISLVRKLANGSFYHKINGRYYHNTFHDGEHRRKKIKINCSLLHRIYPECSLKELLVLTCKMFLVLFSNDKDDPIGREFIWETVIKEWKEPLNSKSPVTIKKRFRIRNGEHWKKRCKRYYQETVFSLYDFSLSIESNINNINEWFSKETIDNYRIKKSVLERWMDEFSFFYFSDEEKKIKTLKRMIRTKQPKKDIMDFLLENKNNIGRKQFFEYKRLLG